MATQTLDRTANRTECAKCRVEWIYYDLTISNGDTTGAADDWDGFLMKKINGAPSVSPTPGSTGTDESKKLIFIEWKTKIPINDLLTKYVGVVKVPRHLQQLGLNDSYVFVSRHTAATANIRGKFIYKEII